MFHSSSSPTGYGEPTLIPQVRYSAAAPQALHDAGGGTHALLFSSSPPYSSPFAPPYLHRSSSTHSLSLHHGIPVPSNPPPFLSSPQHHHLQPPPPLPPPPPSSPPSSSSGDYLDFYAGPVRRVFSTGDLQLMEQGMDGMQASGDNYKQEGTAIPGRIGRYSPEERKERIERYRSKRNQRNFHKKITYACRKTLADSRPRVRGRFAKNGETETETEREPLVEAEVTENSYDCYSSYNNHEQAPTSGGGTNGNEDLWRQMEAAQVTGEVECYYDEDIWASFSDVFPMNPLP